MYPTRRRNKNKNTPSHLSEQEQQDIQEIKAAFECLAESETDKININYLKYVLSPDYQMRSDADILNNNPLLKDVITQLVFENKDVEFEAFYQAIVSKINKVETEKDIKQIFRLFTDNDLASTININNLKQVTKEINDYFTTEELSEIIEEITQLGSGNQKEITFYDFKLIMEKYYGRSFQN